MADDADLFMDLLKNLGSFAEDKALGAIFGDPGSPTLPDIAAAIREEVSKAFFQQSAEDQLIEAAGDLHAAEQFLAVDYQNAQIEAQRAIDGATDKAAETTSQNQRLFTLLDASTTAPGLSALVATAAVLESWITESAGKDGGHKIVAKAATIYLGIYLHICLFHSERSKVAAGSAGTATELDDMRDKARIAINTMMPHVVTLVADRLACLRYSTSPTGGPWDQLYDSWFEPSNNLVVYSGTVMGDDNKDYVAALHVATDATRRLLFNGEQASADACWNAVNNNGWLSGPRGSEMDRRADYLGQTFVSDWNFGKWAANSRGLLMQLDLVATGTGGGEQDQWAWCGKCGVLYYNNGASQCPAPQAPMGIGGAGHLGLTSSNYVLHCDSPSPPAATQTEWRWCKNCGALHYGGGGASVCPNGKGPHASDGSSNYLLIETSMPDPNRIGLAVQDDWKWCSKCGVLHFGAEVSVCPADGGAHAIDGGIDYQLASIGTALGPFIHFPWGGPGSTTS
jgi:hypothetical protein